MSIERVEVELTGRQVDLLLKYAYPFDFEEEQLLKFEKRKSKYHVLETCDFYGPRLVGDLFHATKNIVGDSLVEELDELASIIETSISIASSCGARA